MKSPEPADAAFVADPGWRAIDLLSDVHLREDRPATFAAWRRHLLDTDADAVLILGDLFEAWVGDDVRDEGFEAECVGVLREAGQRRRIGFLPGNRDFLVGDAMLADAGVVRLGDPTLLRAWTYRVLLTHGDALCLADVDYQRFRAEVREPAWQAAFLARPLAERRAIARLMLASRIRSLRTRLPRSMTTRRAAGSSRPPRHGWSTATRTGQPCMRSRVGAGATCSGTGSSTSPRGGRVRCACRDRAWHRSIWRDELAEWLAPLA